MQQWEQCIWNCPNQCWQKHWITHWRNFTLVVELQRQLSVTMQTPSRMLATGLIVHHKDFFNLKKFNMSRGPWWGGFFERLIGIMKRALTREIRRELLQYHELEDVLWDVECFMNNRPLCYVGEEFDWPALNPNTLLRGLSAGYFKEDTEETEYQVCTKRGRYLGMCREQLRERWQDEYLKALQERHQKSQDSGNVTRHWKHCIDYRWQQSKVEVESRKDFWRY